MKQVQCLRLWAVNYTNPYTWLSLSFTLNLVASLVNLSCYLICSNNLSSLDIVFFSNYGFTFQEMSSSITPWGKLVAPSKHNWTLERLEYILSTPSVCVCVACTPAVWTSWVNHCHLSVLFVPPPPNWWRPLSLESLAHCLYFVLVKELSWKVPWQKTLSELRSLTSSSDCFFSGRWIP